MSQKFLMEYYSPVKKYGIKRGAMLTRPFRNWHSSIRAFCSSLGDWDLANLIFPPSHWKRRLLNRTNFHGNQIRSEPLRQPKWITDFQRFSFPQWTRKQVISIRTGRMALWAGDTTFQLFICDCLTPYWASGHDSISDMLEAQYYMHRMALLMSTLWTVTIFSRNGILMYGGPIQAEKCSLKLKVVLKWRDIYIENIRVVLLIGGLKIEGSLKMEGSYMGEVIVLLKWRWPRWILILPEA